MGVLALKDSLSSLKPIYRWYFGKTKKSKVKEGDGGVGNDRCRVWIRIDWHHSEIAPFLSTSVCFASVSLAFLHLTRLLHRRLSLTSPKPCKPPCGCRMFEWVSQAQQCLSLHATATGPSLRCSGVLSPDPTVPPSTSSSYRRKIPTMFNVRS